MKNWWSVRALFASCVLSMVFVGCGGPSAQEAEDATKKAKASDPAENPEMVPHANKKANGG